MFNPLKNPEIVSRLTLEEIEEVTKTMSRVNEVSIKEKIKAKKDKLSLPPVDDGPDPMGKNKKK